MKTPATDPMTAADVPQRWIATVREIAARDGWTFYSASRPGLMITGRTWPEAWWIEGQRRDRPEMPQPLMLPNSGIFFATAADRDAVLSKLQEV